MIKEINKNEISECVNVIRKSFKTIADQFGLTQENAPFHTAFATTEEKLINQFENEHRLMAAYFDGDGKILGYYSLSFLENHECELNNLCVVPECRHKKIGETLIEDAVARAKSNNCTKMKISIVEENTVLRRWYEAHGFVHTNTIKYDFFPFTCGYMEKELI